jgi:hypothetical protein
VLVVPRLVRIIVGLALLASPALAVVPSAHAVARADYTISAPSRFSPNGDGVKDTLRVRYTLPARAHVHLTIGSASSRQVVRHVDLGAQPAGTHTWTWNGRDRSGGQVVDKAYLIRLYDADPAGHPASLAAEQVQVDTVFAPQLTTPTFGAGRNAVGRVYPRTTVTTDAIDLHAVAYEKKVASLGLVIRNGQGRVVRRADVDERLLTTAGGFYATGRTVSWAAVRGGKPLPRGRYTAIVSGGDLAGNTGRSKPLRIWVSDDELEWQETTTTVTPVASYVGVCAYSTANGCGDYASCGKVVPSTMYADGLSYRPAACVPVDGQRSDAAVAQHMLEVPEATGVRGLAAVRVSFVGAPTTAGEPDTGTLYVPGAGGGSSVVGTSGQSAWVADPAWGEGLDRSYPLPQRDPAALWSFGTSGASSVDVASFTVEVRYLAVVD